MQDWDFFRGEFHPQIAARHHDAIGGRDDRLERIDRRGLFELGHDPGSPADQLLELSDIVRALHERERDPVNTDRQAEREIFTILLGQRRHWQDRTRHVHALAIGDGAGVERLHFGKILSAGKHPQAHLAVVDQQILTGFDRSEDFRVQQRHTSVLADGRIEVKPQPLPDGKVHSPADHLAQAQLRSLQIHQDSDRAAHIGLDLPDGIVASPVILMGSVAEIQPENIDPGIK